MTPSLSVLLTRWQSHRVSSRKTEEALIAEHLAPVGRIPSRSALVARAATRRIPLALNEPDSSPALAYVRFDRAAVRSDGMSPAQRRSLTVDDPIAGADAPPRGTPVGKLQ